MTYNKTYTYYIVVVLLLMLGVAGFSISVKAAEYYHTPKLYSCMVYGQPSAFGLAKRMAKGQITNHDYDIILESNSFDYKRLETIHLAYALYVISERIGDSRAKENMEWLERYLDEESIDRITSVIYRKYSKSYLETCFSVDGWVPPLSVNDIYPLYMD
jgi:hypothetical protein